MGGAGILASVKPTPRFLATALACTLAASCSGVIRRMPAAAQGKQSDSIQIPESTHRIEVQFHDGLLAIESGDQPRCDVETKLYAEDETTLAIYKRNAAPYVGVGAEPGSLVVRAALPPGAPIDAVRTTWRLRVPEGTKVSVTTRCGAVVVRGMSGTLEVNGGTGVVEATLAGGSARISTTSGSLILRGAYSQAEVRSTIGRIDLALPPTTSVSSEVRATTRKGEIFVEVAKGQWFEARRHGETNLVRCDAEVRGEWNGSERSGEVDWATGRVGDLTGTRAGMLWLAGEAPVYVRLLPGNPFPTSETTR